MKQIISSLLIWLIFCTHSTWAMEIHLDTKHENDLTQTEFTAADIACDHCCHVSAHVTGLFSTFQFQVNTHKQTIATIALFIIHSHAPHPPYRPPKT